MTEDPLEGRSPRDLPPGERWVETRPGGLFFASALLVAPAAMAVLPWLLGEVGRSVGVIEGPARLLDTIPTMAWYFVPRLGWLALPAAWLTWTALRAVDRRGPRGWLVVFLVVHLSTLGLAVARWIGAIG